jgi:ketosteroid isomerase-like protein
VRVTTGLEKMSGRWMVTHEHISVPFNMQTMQALLDLQP